MRLLNLLWTFRIRPGKSTRLALLFFGSLVMGDAFAQRTLTGKITTEKGVGIEGSTVRISETKAGSVTDKEGMFKLESVSPGNYTLLISTVGYMSQKVKFLVQAGESAPIGITLKEATYKLDEVVIEERKNSIQVERLPDIHNLYLTAGKKNEVIQMSAVNGNIAKKTCRQIFAKIPSVFVYDMDGSGNKINISTRGLDPHRSWEYNIRQNVKDSINPATNQYKARHVDIDNFRSFTSELRLVHQYRIAGMTSFLSACVQYMDNTLRRRQLGKGTTGSDFDLTVSDPQFGRDLYMKTKNIAVFVENLLYITPQLTVSPGLRIESGVSDVSGSISYYNPVDLPNSIKHKFPLFGINSQYRLNTTNKIYAGISQAYRPMVFKDIIPGSVLEQVDKNLKDGFGYNLEAGITCNMGSLLTYDIGLFQMLYNNRMGMLSMNDNTNQAYLLRTNIGNTMTKEVEFYAEYKPLHFDYKSGAPTELSFFTSTAYFDAKYIKGSAINTANENTSIVGNKLEGVPTWITRNGLQLQHRKLSATLQYSYISESFADPLNTVAPSATAARGLVPSYEIWDFNGTLLITKSYTLRFGVNNFMNKQYFTKRPTMYPGEVSGVPTAGVLWFRLA